MKRIVIVKCLNGLLRLPLCILVLINNFEWEHLTLFLDLILCFLKMFLSLAHMEPKCAFREPYHHTEENPAFPVVS